MNRWKAVQRTGKRAAAAAICTVLAMIAPLTVSAAEATDSDGGREAAASVISEAGGEEYGTQVVSEAGEMLSDEDTTKAIKDLVGIMENMLIGRAEFQPMSATAEEGEGPAGKYRFSGAGRSTAQIRRGLENLKAYISEQGERVTEAEEQFFVLKGTTEIGEEWSVSYLPADMQLRFVYRIGGGGSSAMVRMSYDMETLEVNSIGSAAWGSVDNIKYAAAWEAPFHRVLSINIQDLAFSELYSNFKEGHEFEYRPALVALNMAAFDCWQGVLTEKQGTGLGELGFGMFDTWGWVRNADGRWMYIYSNNTYAASGFKEIGGKKFHFDRGGLMDTGWIEENGKKYYCGENGVVVTGTVTIGTEEYTFDESGVLQE